MLSYTVPYYFGKPNWTLQISGLYDKTRDVLTFTSTRGQGSVQLTDQVTPTTSIAFRYSYRHVVASNLQIQAEEIPLFSQPTEVSFFTVSWLRDHRDSPVDPTQGTFNSATLDYAARSFGSSASFLRATLQDSTYNHIGQAAGQFALDAAGNTAAAGAFHREQHSAAGAVLRRWRHLAAGLRPEPGRTARPADGLSHRRLGHAGFNQQQDAPMSAAAAWATRVEAERCSTTRATSSAASIVTQITTPAHAAVFSARFRTVNPHVCDGELHEPAGTLFSRTPWDSSWARHTAPPAGADQYRSGVPAQSRALPDTHREHRRRMRRTSPPALRSRRAAMRLQFFVNLGSTFLMRRWAHGAVMRVRQLHCGGAGGA